MTVALHCNRRLWMEGGGTSPRFTAGVKAYSINIDTQTSCLAVSPDWAPFGHRPVPCLSWVRSEDRMAAASTCSANVTCLSAAHRHTLTAEIWAQCTFRRVRLRLMQALRRRCMCCVIYLRLQFSALTHLTALTLASDVCVCTLVYTCTRANSSKYVCTHTDMNTNIF